MMPLSEAKPGVAVRLVSVAAERALTRRLAELGLTLGCALRVVHKVGGPLVVAARGSRIALGPALAKAIQVEVIE